MDYEKEYKAARERCRWLLANGKISEIAATDLFRELIASEDERIRKHLITHFQNKTKGVWNGMPVKRILSWLEKQKEQKPARWRPISECGDIPDGHYVVGAFCFGDFRLGIMCNGVFVDPNGNRAEQPKEVFYIPNADEKLKYEKIMESDPDAIEKTPKQDYSIDMKYLDLAIVLAEADKSYNLADGLKRLRDKLKEL